MREPNKSEKLRQIIRHEVEKITPMDQLEQGHITETLQWIDSNLPLFRIERPDKPPKHLVSYFVLIDPEQKSVLLVDHIKAQLWLPSGGHVKPDEHPQATVIRKCLEELGRSATFLRNNSSPFFITVTETVGLTPGHTDVSLWYLLQGKRYQHINFDRREFNDIEWFTFDEIMESQSIIFDPNMHRFVQKLQNYLD